MAEDPDATSTKPSDWSYVSEGGATIVFSYVGPQHPIFSRTVLRLRKTIIIPPPRPIFKPLDVAEEWERKLEDEREEALGIPSDDDDEEPDDPTIEFQDRVTSLLIPSNHLPRLEPAHVDQTWLQQLSDLTNEQRPKQRRAKDAIDVSKTKAVLATDLVGGKGWAVEIKPKWAFLPNPTHLSDETGAVKTQYCRFCMHSHQKVSVGDTAAQGYCPLDLFSADKGRISKALSELWSSWVSSNGKVNNLRVFVAGKAILPKDAPTLLAPLLKIDEEVELNDLLAPFTEAVLPLLLDTTLLSTLSTLQRTLDPLDIEGVSALWKINPASDHDDDVPVGLKSPEPTMEEWVSFAQEYLESNAGRDYNLTELGAMEAHRLRFYVLAYLMSATFKDCSVILRLDSGVAKDSVTAIDLDPKSVERLRKWEAQDYDIVMDFKKALESGKITQVPCKDANVQIELPELKGGRIGAKKINN